MKKYAPLLALFAPLAFSQAQSTATLEDSLISIPSSSQRAAAVRRAGQTTDRETLLSVMRVARTIQSSEDKSRVLEALAPRYLDHTDTELVKAYFRAVRTVPSSEELRDLLIAAVPFAATSDPVTNQIIDAARVVPSSPERSEVLTALVESGAVRSDLAREHFVDATQEIPGEKDRQRVARAAARH